MVPNSWTSESKWGQGNDSVVVRTKSLKNKESDRKKDNINLCEMSTAWEGPEAYTRRFSLSCVLLVPLGGVSSCFANLVCVECNRINSSIDPGPH